MWVSLAVILLAAAVRAPRMTQGLWFDEMTTLIDYVLQPWSKVVAAGQGQYVPNNHVLHTVLAKAVYTAVTGGRAAAERGDPPSEAVLRLPAVAAGCLLPVALAWPLRRRSPAVALAVAVVAAVHPWLVVLSTEARGYTLMLLLGVVATHLLPRPGGRWRPAAYALALAGSVLTIPLAVLLVPAHAAAVWATAGRRALRPWAAGAALALLLTTGGYLPSVMGLVSYYRHPYPAAMTYRYFLDSLPRQALAGQRLPRQHVDPTRPPPWDARPDPAGASVFWALPVLVVVLGTVVAWPRFPDARPLLATLAVATAVGVVLPLAVPGATEVRFVTWAPLWFCLAVTLLVAATADVPVYGRPLAVAALAVLLTLMARWDAGLLTNQPIREAIRLANARAPADEPIVVAFMAAAETVACYADDAPGHQLVPAEKADDFRQAVATAREQGGRLPWVVVPFEQLARDRAATDADAADLWHELQSRYRPVARLPGRVVAVAVYAPRDPTATTPAEADGE